MTNKYKNNGFNPKIAKGKDIKNPSNRQILRMKKRLIETLILVSTKKDDK
jgi:hypothetical protein